MTTDPRTASSSAAERIVLSHTGLCCAAGDQALGAWGAAVLHLSAAEPDESTVAPCASGQGDAPPAKVWPAHCYRNRAAH